MSLISSPSTRMNYFQSVVREVVRIEETLFSSHWNIQLSHLTSTNRWQKKEGDKQLNSCLYRTVYAKHGFPEPSISRRKVMGKKCFSLLLSASVLQEYVCSKYLKSKLSIYSFCLAPLSESKTVFDLCDHNSSSNWYDHYQCFSEMFFQCEQNGTGNPW